MGSRSLSYNRFHDGRVGSAMNNDTGRVHWKLGWSKVRIFIRLGKVFQKLFVKNIELFVFQAHEFCIRKGSPSNEVRGGTILNGKYEVESWVLRFGNYKVKVHLILGTKLRARPKIHRSFWNEI